MNYDIFVLVLLFENKLNIIINSAVVPLSKPEGLRSQPSHPTLLYLQQGLVGTARPSLTILSTVTLLYLRLHEKCKTCLIGFYFEYSNLSCGVVDYNECYLIK